MTDDPTNAQLTEQLTVRRKLDPARGVGGGVGRSGLWRGGGLF